MAGEGLGASASVSIVEHEGVATALKSVVGDLQGPGLDCERPEDLLAGQDPFRRGSHPHERLVHSLAGERGGHPERCLQAVGFAARKIVVVVPPPGPQRCVLAAAVGQDLVRAQHREPSQGRRQIDELDAHSRRERQRRCARVGSDGDIDGATRVELAKFPEHQREVQGCASQSAVLTGDEQRIQPHVVVDDPHYGARPAPGEYVQVRL